MHHSTSRRDFLRLSGSALGVTVSGLLLSPALTSLSAASAQRPVLKTSEIAECEGWLLSTGQHIMDQGLYRTAQQQMLWHA